MNSLSKESVKIAQPKWN